MIKKLTKGRNGRYFINPRKIEHYYLGKQKPTSIVTKFKVLKNFGYYVGQHFSIDIGFKFMYQAGRVFTLHRFIKNGHFSFDPDLYLLDGNSPIIYTLGSNDIQILIKKNFIKVLEKISYEEATTKNIIEICGG